MTDPTDLIAQADAALDGVTEGPWQIVDCDTMGDRCTHYYQEVWNSDFDVLVTTEVTRAHCDGGRKNVRFIAASRQLVPALRDAIAAERARVAAMEAENARLRKALQRENEAWKTARDVTANMPGTMEAVHKHSCAAMERVCAALTGEPQR